MAYTDIDNPELYFKAKTYTGSGSSLAVTLDGSENLQPDWLWIKNRGTSDENVVHDSVRGVGKRLITDGTQAEATTTNQVSSFDSDGFTVPGGSANTGASSNNYVGWCWKAAGSTATNTEGNVNTTISANTTAGFSIISADPGSTSGELTLGHGLGTVPTMFIWKNLETAGQNWQVFHQNTGTGLLILNSNAGKNTDVTFWNTHTTTLFKMTTHMYAQNKDFIGYCFSDRKGFLKCGEYKGNGNANGSFVWTGQKSAWIMVKRTDTSGYEWSIWDNKRNPFNLADTTLRSNSSASEATIGDHYKIDILANGFKFKTSNGDVNAAGATYIFMCFAESPLVNSKGVPNNAR